jgi:hypothetical protein
VNGWPATIRNIRVIPDSDKLAFIDRQLAQRFG